MSTYRATAHCECESVVRTPFWLPSLWVSGPARLRLSFVGTVAAMLSIKRYAFLQGKKKSNQVINAISSGEIDCILSNEMLPAWMSRNCSSLLERYFFLSLGFCTNPVDIWGCHPSPNLIMFIYLFNKLGSKKLICIWLNYKKGTLMIFQSFKRAPPPHNYYLC